MTPPTNHEQVLEIFGELRRAMLDNDLETLNAWVADDYRGSDAGGRIHGRDGYLQAYGPGGVELETLEVRQIETISWADTVLVRGKAEISGRYGEHLFDHRLSFLDVYAKRAGNWQLVASHVCDIVADDDEPA